MIFTRLNLEEKNITIENQIDKVYEELGEVVQAIRNKDTENFYEEIFDVMVSVLNLCDISINRLPLEELTRISIKHAEKLKNRENKLNGFKTNGYYHVRHVKYIDTTP